MLADAPLRPSDVPRRVERCLDLLRTHGAWHLVSSNPPVRGCAEAAEHRRRLGSIGIPLCDELKSLLFAYVDGDDRRRYVLLHTRGHQRVDLDKASRAVGADLTFATPEELQARFDANSGTVNPLLVSDDPNVRQVVDDTVVTHFFAPGTLMTNCGHREYAIEFRAPELFDALPRTTVCDIVDDADKHRPEHTTLGILTGNSPESGMLLWERINSRIRHDHRVRFRGDVSMPRIIIESIPDMGSSMELRDRADDVRATVCTAVERLCASGATVIGVACNTTQVFAEVIERVCEPYGAQFVSMAKETRRHLLREQILEVDLLGITPVADLDKWSGFDHHLRDFVVHTPEPVHAKTIRELAYLIKREIVSSATVNRLRDVMNRATSTETIVVALTELSVVLAQRTTRRVRSEKRIVDTLDLLAARMAELHLEDRVACGGD